MRKEFYSHITTYLISKCHYEVSEIYPCVLRKETKNGMILCGLYVDDVLFIGETKQIGLEIELMKKQYNLSINKKLNDYVGCEIHVNDNITYLHQTKLIMKMLSDFEEKIEKTKSTKSPMAIHIHIVRETDEPKLYEL